MQLLGTHGTSETRAAAILASNVFKVSLSGYAGRGAYFWAYVSDEKYGRDLAECWWAFAKQKKNLYHGDADQSLAVLGVEIAQPGSGKLFDATDQLFVEALARTMTEKNCKQEDLPEVTAVLIEEMESANGSSFDVVKVEIPTPPYVSGANLLAVRWVSRGAKAYLVKDSGLNLINNIRRMN